MRQITGLAVIIACAALVAARIGLAQATNDAPATRPSTRPATGPATRSITRVYYTTDDGQSWFVDDAKRVPPFSKDGKEAVKACVFRTGLGRPPFVGFLVRYTPEGKKRLENALAEGIKLDPAELAEQREFKRVGVETWLKLSDDGAGWRKGIIGPDGKPAEEVFPE